MPRFQNHALSLHKNIETHQIELPLDEIELILAHPASLLTKLDIFKHYVKKLLTAFVCQLIYSTHNYQISWLKMIHICLLHFLLCKLSIPDIKTEESIMSLHKWWISITSYISFMLQIPPNVRLYLPPTS